LKSNFTYKLYNLEINVDFQNIIQNKKFTARKCVLIYAIKNTILILRLYISTIKIDF